jgi:hypothetical protein
VSIAVVQTATTNNASSISFTNNVTPGNAVVLWQYAYTNTGAAISTSSPVFNAVPVTGAALLLAQQSAGASAVYGAVWILPNLAGGAKPVGVTVTGGIVDTNVGIIAVEYAGLGTAPVIDTAAAAVTTAGSSGIPASGSTGALAASLALILGMAVEYGVNITGPASPWTENNPAGTNLCAGGYQVATSSGGTYGYTCTAGSGAGWSAGAVAVVPGGIIRLNSASISGGSATATATTTIPAGTTILAGDLIIVSAGSQTGHVTNGISVKDGVNNVNYTTLLETDLGASSSRWIQSFRYVTPSNIADGTTITCTGYTGAANTEFALDVFRAPPGCTWSVDQSPAGSSNASSTSSAAPALAASAAAGALVITNCEAGSGTLTPGAAFAKGSSGATGASIANGYVLSASGASTYASTWTLGTANTSAAQTVSLTAAPPAGGAAQALVAPQAAVMQAANW